MRSFRRSLRIPTIAAGVVFLLACFPGNARATQSLGVQAGMNFAGATAQDGNGNPFPINRTAKITGGVFYDLTFAGIFGLMTELNYKGSNTGADYLTLPVQLKLNFELGSLRPFVVIGPEVAVKLSGVGLKTLDLLAVAGGGLAFDIAPNMAFHVLARYELGIANCADVQFQAINVETFRNNGIHLLAGVSFLL